jgi:hypothetical protein
MAGYVCKKSREMHNFNFLSDVGSFPPCLLLPVQKNTCLLDAAFSVVFIVNSIYYLVF